MPTQVKEKPIIFSGEMIKAILDGRKSQTRRVIKPQPDLDKRRHNCGITFEDGRLTWGRAPWYKTDPNNHLVEGKSRCPYGIPGDRLWVAESYWYRDAMHDEFLYEADGEKVNGQWNEWHPAEEMPMLSSRITIEITDVRVERVQDITEKDSYAEGIDDVRVGRGMSEDDLVNVMGGALIATSNDSPIIYKFRRLCDSIYDKKGFDWDVNPWVWVIEFKMIGGEG